LTRAGPSPGRAISALSMIDGASVGPDDGRRLMAKEADMGDVLTVEEIEAR